MFCSFKVKCILLFLTLMLILSACASDQLRPTTTVELTSVQGEENSPTPLPTYTPTLAAQGSQENPYLIGLIDATVSENQHKAAEELAAQLSEALGMYFAWEFFADYLQLEEALQKNIVQFVWLQPIEYILSAQKQLLTSVLVTNHLGVTAYGVQFLANSSSNFSTFYDSGTQTSTANAAAALQQFAGLRPCFISQSSLSGYWVPNGFLTRSAITTQPPVFTYSTSASIRALYIKGVCDFAATYAYFADPRTSSEIITDLPDALSIVPIIWASGKIIPNLNLSAAPTLDLALRNRLAEFLIQLVRTDNGKQLITTALDYEVAGLDGLQDGTYDELRSLLRSQGVNLYSLLNQ